jgi:hypothetical protein
MVDPLQSATEGERGVPVNPGNNAQNMEDLERKARIESEIIEAEEELAKLESELAEIDDQLGLATEADDLRHRAAEQKRDEATHIRKLIHIRREELQRLKSRPPR